MTWHEEPFTWWTRWVDSTPTSEVTPVTMWYILTPDLGHQMVMVMNDLLTPPLFNVNRPSHPEIQLFQNLTMKILGQHHAYGQRSRLHFTLKIQRSRSLPRSNLMVILKPKVQSICLLFVSWQSDHFGLRYSKLHIWPWKVKVKVMANVKPDGHIWGLEFNRYVCFSFPGNQTIFGWDIANSMFDLENSRSRSWPRSNSMVTFETQSSIDMFAFCFVAIGPFLAVRYSKFHIWPWKFKVKVTTKIDQNLLR